jgi:hypothetical protein
MDSLLTIITFRALTSSIPAAGAGGVTREASHRRGEEVVMIIEDKHDEAGRQPDPERSLEAAARAKSKKPDSQGLEATRQTASEPHAPESKQSDAAEILKRNSEQATGKPNRK